MAEIEIQNALSDNNGNKIGLEGLEKHSFKAQGCIASLIQYGQVE